MSTSDTSEKGLEALIMRHMTGVDLPAEASAQAGRLAFAAEGIVAETPDALAAAKAAGSGWLAGNPKDYDRTHALDVPQLFSFLHATQADTVKKLGIADYKDARDINRQKFLARLSNEIGKRGVIDVLRKGVDHGPLHFDLFYGTPSPGNAKAAALHEQNRFSVTRQLRYSTDETRRALDLLDKAQVYSPEQVQSLVDLFMSGAPREQLDPILDRWVAVYKERLDEDGQVDFKGKAKAFTRTYDFLASVIPYTNRDWERLSIVLNLLIPKLPAPKDEDLSKGILESIDRDSYRVEKKAAQRIALADDHAEIGPVPVEGGGHKREPELDRLSNILRAFNDRFGALFTDADRVARRIRDDIAPKVAADPAYQNAKRNTPHTARMAHDLALGKAMQNLLKDDTQVYKQFVENESFKRFVTDMVFAIACE